MAKLFAFFNKLFIFVSTYNFVRIHQKIKVMNLTELKQKFEEVKNIKAIVGGSIDNAPEEKERGVSINSVGGSIDNAPEEKERGISIP